MQEKTIYRLAGTTFNLNSPRQLGQILFDVLKIGDAPKKTKTGQYATDEQTLAALAADHEIVQRLLEYRTASKLKSTYADALPAAIWPRTGRVHTTFNQVMTTTGRLNSQNPNLQNIPIRTERGQEIRKAFVPRGREYRLLSADYSQIELRIIAALSREPAMLEAFRTGADIHTATAARVFGVPAGHASRRRCGARPRWSTSASPTASRPSAWRSAWASRATKPARSSTSTSSSSPASAVTWTTPSPSPGRNGYVETVTGRRRYIRDIRSANNTVRGAAERNAINAPIQGTAADMIKLAMIAHPPRAGPPEPQDPHAAPGPRRTGLRPLRAGGGGSAGAGRGEDEDRHPAGRADSGGDGRGRELAGGTLARIVRTPMDMPTVRRGHAAYKRTPPLL